MGQQDVLDYLKKIDNWAHAEQIAPEVKLMRPSVNRLLRKLYNEGLVLKKLVQEGQYLNKRVYYRIK